MSETYMIARCFGLALLMVGFAAFVAGLWFRRDRLTVTGA